MPIDYNALMQIGTSERQKLLLFDRLYVHIPSNSAKLLQVRLQVPTTFPTSYDDGKSTNRRMAMRCLVGTWGIAMADKLPTIPVLLGRVLLEIAPVTDE